MRSHAIVALVTALTLVTASSTALTETTKKVRTKDRGTDWLLVGGVSALAVGGVFIGLGIYESVTIKDTGTDFVDDPTFKRYQNRFPPTVSDVCSSAKSGKAGSPPASPDEMNEVIRLCDSPNEASKKRTLGYMFYGVGILSLAIGTTMILMRPSKSDEEKETKSASIRIEPVVTPTGGALFVLGRF